MRNTRSRDPRITSQIMSKIRSKNTAPEIILAKALRKIKIKFRRHPAVIGTPDFLIFGKKVVIFCDGDFWHGHNWRLRKLRSRAAEFSTKKKDYWLKKIKTNIARDKKVNHHLKTLNYKVLRFWESDINKNVNRIIRSIERAL